MPRRAALPLTIGILPRLFGRNRKRGDERAGWCVVCFGIDAAEADDRELVHVHFSSPFLPPGRFGGNRTASGPAPNRSRSALLGGPALLARISHEQFGKKPSFMA